jgi:lipid II isoglutaminyl synthase (glutamine-hydrolysing)
MNQELHLLHVYPNEMNIYGDRGNLLTLMRRMEWHGYKPVVHFHHAGHRLPETVHMVLGGGGQDSAQADIQADVLRIGGDLHKLADAGVPMLMICGMYQLFGHRFVTHDKRDIKGIGIFDLETIASARRMVGNVMVQSERFGTLFGFENHSGRTVLASGQMPLGTVLRGGGNNGDDKTEGAVYKNVVGAYLHGPMLPNNPHFADELIRLTAVNVYGDFHATKIDDSLVEATRANAAKRSY